VARHTGDLHLLTIAAIFLVVFTAMWGGVQHSRGDLLPEEPINAGERQVRSALWAEVVDWRVSQGFDRPRRVSEVTVSAQSAAAAFAAGNRSSGTTTGTDPPETGPHPTGSDRCSQLLVRHTVDDPRWTDVSANGTNETVAVAVAGELLPVVVDSDEAGLLARSGEFRTGLGVAARGDRLYVVYRSCARRRLP
jgi:hypothetical protein